MKLSNNDIRQFVCLLILSVLIFGCSPKVVPNIEQHRATDTVYLSKVKTILKTKFDTITILQDDTCNLYKMSFNSLLNYYNDAQKIIKIQKDSMEHLTALSMVGNLPKKMKKNSTITIVQNSDDSKVDNSKTNQKVKDNSAIGQDNQLSKTTKKNNWLWIYIAGFLSAVIANFTFKNIIRNILPNFKPR